MTQTKQAIQKFPSRQNICRANATI